MSYPSLSDLRKIKKSPEQSPCFIIENFKILKEIHSNQQHTIQAVYLTTSFYEKENAFFQTLNPNLLHLCSPRQLQSVSSLKTNERCLALITPPPTIPFSFTPKQWVIATETLNNPNNLGALIRSADWFGIRHIICHKNSVSQYNPKVISASMGSLFNVRLHYADLADFLIQAQQNRYPIYAAACHKNSISLYDTPPLSSGILLLGNESHGISAELLQKADRIIHIPKTGTAESLNINAAAAVLLSHLKPS